MNAQSLGRPKTDPSRDLKRDLLLTSRQLLDEGGPAALSMRGHMDMASLALALHAGQMTKPMAAPRATGPSEAHLSQCMTC